MKKLLYISASPKPETESVSKQAARTFIQRLMSQVTSYKLDELDLYTSDIPMPSHQHFDRQSHLVTGGIYEALSDEDKSDVDKMNTLCTQFQEADTYVISAPMWGMSFPSRLKQYLDCIMLIDHLFTIDSTGFHGLLGDKERHMVYVQSSGGVYPKIFFGQMNYAVKYCRDIFKHLGVSTFDPILAQGTETPGVGRYKALEVAAQDMDDVLNRLSGPHPMPIGA
ncbi:FMN-dependent NADH-azoreductase [Ethanoligenens sp.]|uniref:FMN-dependent NADH-azoreductase n=1 Tax=Ethanoligenens sp. TaxID=2099655 RepID=UPI0039EA6EC3